ncbi:MAG TPA: DUF1254 domain-containing protein [Lysobacter sp.]
MRTVVVAVAVLLLGACQRQPAPASTESAKPDSAAATASAPSPAPSAPRPEPGSVPVNADNFIRAESDLYFSSAHKDGGLGKFFHRPEVTAIDKQTVIRMNRDTLYSSAVLDLDAGPVTITLPDPGKRFMSMQVISEDHYTPQVAYRPGRYTLTKEDVGTRYALVALRILVNPNDPEDVKQVHALQQAIKVEQAAPGTFEVPKWDAVSQKRVRDALLTLAADLPDTRGAFGTKAEVDPVRRLIATASAWGGNPDKDAMYLNVTPERNDGSVVYRLHVADVPVDGFWSVSVYDAKGYYQANPRNAYTLNNVTAKPNQDGSVDIQFGGCDDKAVNCLPVTPGWNYMVRLYRPRAEVLNGTWKFPEAQPVGG